VEYVNPEKSSHIKTNGLQNTSAVVQTPLSERAKRQESRAIHFLTQDELRIARRHSRLL
jgi:hypothetical protein